MSRFEEALFWPLRCSLDKLGVTKHLQDIIVKAALFDLDGTVIHSLDLWLDAYHHSIGSLGFELSEAETIEKLFYRHHDQIALEFGLESGEVFTTRVKARLKESFKGVSAFPDAVETLRFLKEQGVLLGLVTSSYRHLVDHTLEKLELLDVFGSIVAFEDVVNLKPHPEPILVTLERLGVGAHEAIFIGDSEVDIKAAKAAKVRAALHLPSVHERFYNFTDLRAHGAEHEFSDYSALRTVMGFAAPE